MMRPPFCCRMAGMTWEQQRKTLSRSTDRTSFHCLYTSLAQKPLLRKAIVNLPPFAFKAVTGSSGGGEVAMVRYDADGNLLEYLLCEGSGFTVTGGVETGERLYLESITSADRIYFLER